MKTKLIPFDIEKAKNGAKIVTRSGLSAKRVDVDVNNGHPVLCLVTWKDGIETPILYSIDGRYYPDQIDDKDLFIEENEVEETDDYDPYKATVESIADMVERYSDAGSDLQDFYDQVRARCREAVEYEKKWIKNQGEQKSFNTVKPKFKVGDWIVNKGHSYLIADIDYLDNRYLFEIGGYTHEKLNWEYIKNADEHYHLWTMRQDAENGDVIACNSSIMLFKEIDDLNNIKGHCTYHFTDTPMFFVDSLSTRDVFHPATKEQRDLLFQKMKEAGYEWDPVKKELKKVKPKFQKGNWVIDKQGTVHQIANVIENVTNHTYGYDVVGGGYFNENVKDIRLWTIQDARNGIVLACDTCIVLFKEIDGLNIKCHCTYHFMDTPMFFVDTLQNKTAFYPATKEQRDLLFQKIKEKGYEWNSDTKELKKIDAFPAEKKIKTRRMTNQELSWWLRDHPEEHRECRFETASFECEIFTDYPYLDSAKDCEVPDKYYIRKNGREWQEPLVEI